MFQASKRPSVQASKRPSVQASKLSSIYMSIATWLGSVNSQLLAWIRPERLLTRVALPGAGATVALILTASVTLASGGGTTYCIDPNNSQQYATSNSNYWYAQIATTNGNCTTAGCPYVYETQGGKGNLSTGGQPYTFDNSTQHVLEWITAMENPSNCTNTIDLCWIQVGWEVGHSSAACGGYSINASSPEVEVEIYDDSSNPCFMSTFGSAPTNASYDARFYTTLSNGLHRYEVYFEVPGSNNIQVLAYGDFHNTNTSEIAAGEAFSGGQSSNGLNPYCPVLGQTNIGDWNYDGAPASQNTFASNMNLYQNGSWYTWTTSVAPTSQYLNPPYQISPVSNFGAGNYSEWMSGGPQ